ncbi:AzlC family ABC transporter permease [Streptosporangium sp. NPDC000396]|uniref:AzlC family ABC transporter permease n=1 Tax=Streptosporangium sp. NPDC000396 TaxID=3366185 RepID=UPI003695F6DE
MTARPEPSGRSGIRSDLGLALGAAAGAATYSAVFGAAAVDQGWSAWEAVLASVAVHAGGSQIVGLSALSGAGPGAAGGASWAAGLDGGSLVAAVVAASLVNLRLTAFGLALGDVFRTRWGRWLAAHLVSDESVAAAVTRQAPAARRRTFLVVGSLLFAGWVGGTGAGAVLGSALPAGAREAVNGAAAAAFAALLAPLLRTRRDLAVATGAGALALVASWWLPPGLPVLLAALAAVPFTVRPA